MSRIVPGNASSRDRELWLANRVLGIALTLFSLTFFSLISSCLHSSAASTEEERGLEIALEADRRNAGWETSLVDLEMMLIDAQGNESVRSLRLTNIEVVSDSEGDKSLTYFYSPADIEGTALLSFAHIHEDDDQWLYLPALKRVKRISSSNKTGAFVGSELSYEDLIAQEVQEFAYKYLNDEACPGEEAKDLRCFVIERYPSYEDSGYSKQRVWLDSNEYRLWKTQFFDHNAEHFKTMTASNYRQYLGEFWRAQKLLMENHLNNRRTVLNFSDYVLRTEINEGQFDPNALTRLR